MWRKTSSILISFVVIAVSAKFCLADCPSADLTGDCFVDYEDFAVMAGQWLTSGPCVPDDMVLIPGGTFEMGDSFEEGDDGELPVHTVTLDSFYMGKYEITNEQYCAFLNWADDNRWITVTGTMVYKAGSGTSYPYFATHNSCYSQIDYNDVSGVFSVTAKAGRDMSNDPILYGSWYGAVAYCNWRSQQEGKEQCYNLSTWDCDFSKKGYRLATEAEWEYAARGGLSGRRFPWGDTISHSQANYQCSWQGGSPYWPYDVSPTEGHHPMYGVGGMPYTAPVGSFSANGYGLYDMAGNVWEWCNDWYDSTYYASRPNPDVNPTGPAGPITYRVLRGGGWDQNAYHCRVASRYYIPPGNMNDVNGFRIVLDLN
ncbi:MAG: formylglycine-generating enzyme family protein [Planctomycetes bacterium]|nr:formylglycine-generating enzyme family protein [Planctomycetota bacterium]